MDYNKLKRAHSIETFDYVNKQYNRTIMEERAKKRSNHKIESTLSESEQINKLAQELLQRMKRDLPISSSNFRIEVVRIEENEENAKLYFHVCNSDAREELEKNSPDRQDCYGIIDVTGKTELYISREVYQGLKEPVEVAFAKYSEKEQDRIQEIKNAIAKESLRMKEEEKEWYNKSALKKVFAKITGNEPRTNSKLIDFLSGIAGKLSTKQSSDFIESLKVKDVYASSQEVQNSEEHILEQENFEQETSVR